MISIVTITYNNYDELIKTLQSLPKTPDIESIVINGGTCVRTTEFLQNYSGTVVSEKDKGIADAFNKGAHLARGDAIAFLNSGDVLVESDYYSRVGAILKKPSVSFVYADLLFDDQLAGKMVFKSQAGTLSNIGKGMPFPHPTLVVKKTVFEEVGDFNLNYKIGMDYEWVIRLLKKNHLGEHIPTTPVLMDGAGVSSLNQEKSILECARALREQGLNSKQVMRDLNHRLLKLKAKQFIQRTFGDGAVKILKRIKNR